MKTHPIYRQYAVGIDGSVIGPMGVVLKPDVGRHGYHRIGFWIDGKLRKFLVHRFVAETHIPNPHKLDSVNHIDGDKSNNAAANLEWMSKAENTALSFRLGRRVNKRCKPITVQGVSYYSYRAAERATGIPRRTLAQTHVELAE